MKIFFTISLFFTLLSLTNAQHPDDYRWDDKFSAVGISSPETGSNCQVNVLVSTPDYIVVGGIFTIPGNNIILWNKKTNNWENAGKGVWQPWERNIYPYIQCLYAEGDSVFVGGKFTMIDGTIPSSCFAIFNTRTKVWTASDTMIQGSVNSIVRYNGDIIIGGKFTIKGTSIANYAKWSGGKWSQFGNENFSVPGGLAVFKDSLYCFQLSPPAPAFSSLVKWNGTIWEKIEFMFYSKNNTPIRGIKATSDYLYVYGALDSMILANWSGTVKANNLMRYDGTSWNTILDNSNNKLQTIGFDGNDLIIAGGFTSVDGINATGIVKWNHLSKQWSSLGSGIPSGTLNAILVDGNQVFTAGQFQTAGSQYVNNIALYDYTTSRWYSFGDGNTQAPIVTYFGGKLSVFEDKGKLLAIGGFNYAGNKILNNIGYWTGTDWEPLGTGIVGGAYFPTAIPLALLGPTGLTQFSRMNDTMYLGGSFELLGSEPCSNITTYNDGSTQCVGGGVSESHNPSSPGFTIPAQITSMESIGNDLYVTGDFQKAGTLRIETIAKWDGKQWSALGGGLQLSGNSYPKLVEDSSHNLMVAGKFYKAGGIPCNSLAAWDGQKWEPRGYIVGDSGADIQSICVAPNGDVLVAGFLSKLGNQGAGTLARLKGNSFETIANVANGKNGGFITAMACKGDLLYVAGHFDYVGDIAANKVAMYNVKTGKWSPLGSGFSKKDIFDSLIPVSGTVSTIAFVGDTVYFGGEFSYVGGKSSICIAAWLPAKPNSVEQISTSTTTPTLSIQPNPAFSTATLTFSIPQSQHVTITLRDALGKEVQRISEGELQAGEYQSRIDCTALSSGVYYCVVAGIHSIQTQKLIISR
ncbi:MAG: T9SS type A sorting domain-containing protein [Ignavibacteria bacterium]|nr:T9SS type A sorting domain-containing protein [Ignavibacteria bacterium]